jgi:hypothetical protein
MTAPFACDLTVFSPEERESLRGLARSVFDACDHVRELPDGYKLQFPADGGGARGASLATAVARWVALERRCCPCISFTIEFPEDCGPVAVRMTGRPGIKPFLVAEFKERITRKLRGEQ